jgi:hypothetical protein
MNDTIWQTVRYVLIGVGSFLAGKGKIDPAHVPAMADQIIHIASGAVAVGAAAWGLWVKWKTVPVPEATAARSDVPTVNSATGAIQP